MPEIKFSTFDEYFEDFHPHLCFYSFNGAGKSSLAGKSGMKTVLVDCGDAGVATLRHAKNLKIIRCKSTSQYLDAMVKVHQLSNKIELLVVDTLTGLTSLAIKEVKGKGDMNRRKWGQVGSKIIECVSETRTFPKDVIYLAQEKRRSKEDEEGSVQLISPSLNPGVREYLSSCIDWMGRIYVEGGKRKLSFILTETVEAKDRADPPVFPKIITLGKPENAYPQIRKRILDVIQPNHKGAE